LVLSGGAADGAAARPRIRSAPSLGDLLEREHDLARIGELLGRARQGHCSLAVVEGPAGVGKTALLSDARAVAEAAGMRVLRSRGAELEQEFGFGVVRQLVEPALRAMDDSDAYSMVRSALTERLELVHSQEGAGALGRRQPAPARRRRS
jgi:predicted ATPase